jgi:hypothetical protein
MVLRGLLKREKFETLADLTDALKWECARLRLPWTNEAISAVYSAVGSDGVLLAGAVPLPKRARPEPFSDRPVPVVSKQDATVILAELGVTVR